MQEERAAVAVRQAHQLHEVSDLQRAAGALLDDGGRAPRLQLQRLLCLGHSRAALQRSPQLRGVLDADVCAAVDCQAPGQVRAAATCGVGFRGGGPPILLRAAARPTGDGPIATVRTAS